MSTILDKSVSQLQKLENVRSDDLLFVSRKDNNQWISYGQEYSKLFGVIFQAAHPPLQPIWMDHDPNAGTSDEKSYWIKSGVLINIDNDKSQYYDSLARILNLFGDDEWTTDGGYLKAGGVTVMCDKHKSGIMRTKDKAGLDFMFSATGTAWAYYWDTDKKLFMCPRTIYSFTGIRGSSPAGTAVEAGLPDHQHDVVYQISNCSCAKPNGIRNSHDAKGKLGSVQTSTVAACSAYGASNPTVYGKSNTVQPPAVQMDLYFAV